LPCATSFEKIARSRWEAYRAILRHQEAGDMLLARRKVLIGLGLMSFLPRSAAAAIELIEAGRVLSVLGTSTGQSGGKQRALGDGDRVFLDELIRTGAAARLSLRLGQATRLSLGERTRLRIDRYLVNRGGEMVLERGAILFDRPDNPGSGPMNVATPFALIAARGTKFFAGPSQGVFGVFVEHGLVTVRNRAGSVTLTNGLGTNLRSMRVRPTPPKPWGLARISAAEASVT
jgi:ferric-dicitrate binding protein FerR (iron transport regulator)